METQVTLTFALASVLLLGVAYCSRALPSFDVTFDSSGEVEHHLPEVTIFGTFELGVDRDKDRSYQKESYEVAGKMEEYMVFQLPNVTCHVRNKACVNETRKTSAKPNFWKWLDNATYEGEVQIRHISYGFWGYNVGGLRLEVAVGQNKNKPVYFNRKTAEESTNYYFTKVNGGEPPPDSSYMIPKYCWQ